MFNKKKKCPKCDSTNLNEMKPTTWQKYRTHPFSGRPKTLNVCKDCGFSWEDR